MEKNLPLSGCSGEWGLGAVSIILLPRGPDADGWGLGAPRISRGVEGKTFGTATSVRGIAVYARSLVAAAILKSIVHAQNHHSCPIGLHRGRMESEYLMIIYVLVQCTTTTSKTITPYQHQHCRILEAYWTTRHSHTTQIYWPMFRFARRSINCLNYQRNAPDRVFLSPTPSYHINNNAIEHLKTPLAVTTPIAKMAMGERTEERRLLRAAWTIFPDKIEQARTVEIKNKVPAVFLCSCSEEGDEGVLVSEGWARSLRTQGLIRRPACRPVLVVPIPDPVLAAESPPGSTSSGGTTQSTTSCSPRLSSATIATPPRETK